MNTFGLLVLSTIVVVIISASLYYSGIFNQKIKQVESPTIAPPSLSPAIQSTPVVQETVVPSSPTVTSSESTIVPAPSVPELAPCDQGEVTITWGHTSGDASWACDNWKSSCGNAGGCNATGDGSVVDGKSTWKCNLKTNCKA